VLTGSVASEDQRKKIHDMALSSMGKGGLIAGGVTVVDISAIEIIQPVVDPVWNARRDASGKLMLSGYVSDEAARASIVAEAEKLFPGQVEDRMKIASGAFEGALPQMLIMLGQLQKFSSGEARLKSDVFHLSGAVETRKLDNEITAQMGAISGSYRGTASITSPDPVANEFGIAVEDGAIDDAARCQGLFADALSKNSIRFASGKADIGPQSFAFLDFLTQLSGQCGAFSLTVAGHTDNTGNPAYNVYLSGERAKAVVAYLEGKGIAKERLSSTGFGPDKPVCTENTSACRARNRRIEISVGQ
jgi:OOP family OmpA-OmpF porin